MNEISTASLLQDFKRNQEKWKLETLQNAMYRAKVEQLQSTITQLESDVKVRDGMLAQMASETGNFIKEQAETIRLLKEDAEFWYSRLNEKDYLLWPDHKDKHTDLMNSLEGKE